MSYYRRRKSNALSTTAILTLCGLSILFFVFYSLNGLNIFQDINLYVLIVLFIFILGIVIFFIKFLFRRAQDIRFRNITFSKIDYMTGIEFEDYVAYLYRKMNYNVRTTPLSGDMGVDLIAQKGNEKIAIQIKRYKNAVGRSAISDAVAGMALYNCTNSAVVTNSYFTTLAKHLAHKNNCKLIDRDQLGEMITRIESLQ